MLLDLLGGLIKLLFQLTLFFGFIAVVIYLIRRDRPLLDYSLSHWHSSVPDLQETAAEFYRKVQALVEEQQMPGVVCRVVAFHEGGILSDKRDYLRIRRGATSFDLCVAPFGRTFFVSSWLCENPRNLLLFLAHMPFIGWFVQVGLRLFAPETYYKIDSALMFNGAVHACVLRVLDEATTAQGVEPLPESERKPVMREIYGRRAQFA